MKTKRVQRVLLTNPFTIDDRPNPNVGIDLVVSRHAGQEIKTGVTFPLGLAYLASVLRQEDFEVRCFDPIAKKTPAEEILRASEWADALIVPYSPAHDLDLRNYFSQFSGKIRITGGGFSYHLADELFSPDFCEVILGPEPEFIIADLIRAVPEFGDISGIGWWKDGAFNRNPPSDSDTPLDDLPFPAYDLFDLSRYWDIIFFGQPTMWPLPSRGCPYKCIFCAQHYANRERMRYRSPENFVNEIMLLRDRFGIRCFIFFDETFNLNRKFASRVCEELIRRRAEVHWSCAARPDRVEENVLKLMKEAGCIEMRFGLESANDEILQYLQKDTTVAEIRRGIEIARQVGVTFSLQCIFGSPMETEDTVRRTLEFVRWARPLFVSFNILTPLPGSQLFDELKNRLNLDQLKTFDILHTEIQLGSFTIPELRKIVRKSYRWFYLRPGFFLRLLAEMAFRPGAWLSAVKMMFRQAGYVGRSIFSLKSR